MFTAGVLIHQPDESLKQVMREITRCSGHYILAMEYHSDQPEVIEYRGQTGALIKRNYRELYEKWTGSKYLDGGFLSKDEGWDDVTWCLMEKRRV